MSELDSTNKNKIIVDVSKTIKSSENIASNNHNSNKTIIESFIKRNYSPQPKEKIAYVPQITENELHSCLYTLKNYYNYVTTENKKSDITVDNLKKKNKELIMKEKDAKSAKQFSVNQKEELRVGDTRESIDSIKFRIQKLETELNDIKSRHKFEEEYTSTVRHMTEGDQLQMEKIKESIIKYESKIKDIDKVNAVLAENIRQRKIMNRDYNKCLTTIGNQQEDVEEVINNQSLKQTKLENKTKKKELRVLSLRESINHKNTHQKEELVQYKKNWIQKIDDYKESYEQLLKKETENINLVLGMCIIQKYFIVNDKDNTPIDLKALRNSEDYKIFISNQYTIINSNDEIMMTTQSTRKNDSSPKKRKAILKLEDIKEKIDSLTMTSKDLNDFFSKMRINEQFTRETMINLNQKAITLENIKENYTKKVNEIIAKDYKNFNDLIKINSRFANFIESNSKRTQIEKKAKNQHEHITYNLINSFLNTNHIHPDIQEVKKNAIRFIAQSRKILNDLKAPLESISSSVFKCNLFRDFDDLNISCPFSPVGKNYVNSAKRILQSDDSNDRKEFILTLINYAIEKLTNEDGAYIKETIADPYNMKQILDSDIILEKDIYNFYNSIEDMKLIVNIIETITSFYGKSINDFMKQNPKIRNSISKPVEVSKMLFAKKQSDLCNKMNSLRKKNSFSRKSIDSINAREYSSTGTHDRNLTKQSSNHYDYIATTVDDSFTDNDNHNKRPVTSKRMKSSSITRKLYEPSLCKGEYLRKLNEGLDSVRQDTCQFRQSEYNMHKKWKELRIMKREFYPYQNPKINVDTLSCDTYKIVTSQILDLAKRRNTDYL